MKYRARLLFIGTVMLLFTGLWLLHPPVAVSQGTTPEEEFSRASDLAEQGYPLAAIAAYEALAAQVPGTEMEMRCLMEIGYIRFTVLHQTEAGLDMARQVAQRFPDSHAAIYARLNVADAEQLRGQITLDEFLVRLEDMVRWAGGISIADVLAGSTEPPAAVPHLTAEQQIPLLQTLYLDASGAMHDATRATRERWGDAITLDLYVHAVMPPARDDSLMDSIRFASGAGELVVENGVRSGTFPDDTRPPRIRHQSPHDGQQVSKNHHIAFRLSDGSAKERQIDPERLAVLVDGVDLTPQFRQKFRYRRDCRDPFEERRFRYAPPTPWSPGSHSVQVRVSDYSGNELNTTWYFHVPAGGGPHDDDDDRGHEDDDDGDDRDRDRGHGGQGHRDDDD
ncbi:MAG: hypothetical protein AB1758_04425 [Candidatus Eremiobacterota bacterium]